MSIITFDEAGEIHPAEFVIVNEYVPAAKPDIVLFGPVPLIDPGLIVHVPVGKPPKTTLPVADAHAGCVIVPTVGAVGVAGWEFITELAETGEIHPSEFVTVYK